MTDEKTVFSYFGMISPKQLETIKERCRNTSRGPWIWIEREPEPPYDPMISVLSSVKSGNIKGLEAIATMDAEVPNSRENAEFICKAREDIEKLITVIEKFAQEFKKINKS